MHLLDPLLPLAPALDPIFDPLTIKLGRSLMGFVQGPPRRALVAKTREIALKNVIARWAPRVAKVHDAVAARDPRAVASFDEMLAAAVDELRAAEGTVDHALYTNRQEWLDDAAFDHDLRVRTLDRLDCMNETLGNYDSFLRVIAPLVERARKQGVERPTIVDLASGHAMFAVRMALHFGARENEVRVVATDLAPEYLEIGRKKAEQLGMHEDVMQFVAQDALDLRDVESKIGGRADVVTCTQTAHHFPPGLVARLFREAALVARVGAIVVDGERNVFSALLVAMMGTLIGRGSVPFVHDAVVSMRRMYTEQELALIGGLSLGENRVKRGWVPPGHVWVSTV